MIGLILLQSSRASRPVRSLDIVLTAADRRVLEVSHEAAH